MSERRVLIPFILITLVTFFLSMSLQMTLPSFSVYLNSLDFPLAYIGMVSLSVAFSAMFFRPVSTYLNLKVGPVYTAMIGSVLYIIAFLILVLTKNIMLVVLARILQGIGMGLGITILGSMIALIVPHEELLKGMNIYSLFSASTGALGPYIGMFLIFGDNFIPLFSTALIVTIVGFILLIYMKVKIHLPVPEDIHTQKSGVPIYKSSAVFPALSGSFLALVNAGIVSYISLYAISIGIRNVGFFFLFNFVGLLISRVVLQRIITAISLSWIFVLVGIGLALMLVALTQFDTVFAWAIIAIIYGFLFNFMFTLLNTMALKNVPLSDKAAANAFLFVCLDFGFFLGGIIWGQVAGSYSLQMVFIFGAILITISQALSAVVIWKKQIQF